jgi:hypothetical protein
LYHFKAIATSAGLRDLQDVRVLIDRPIVLNIDYETGYTIKEGARQEPDDQHWLSVEDPFELRIDYPENPALPTQEPQTIKLSYFGGEGNVDNFEDKEVFQAQEGPGERRIAFPIGGGTLQDFENVVVNNPATIDTWKETLEVSTDPLALFTQTATGQFDIDVGVGYCDGIDEPQRTTSPIIVHGCIPHEAPGIPWAYNPHDVDDKLWQLEYGAEGVSNEEFLSIPLRRDSEGKIELGDYTLERDGDGPISVIISRDNVNPFKANHACCRPNNWQPFDADIRRCMEVPTQGCFASALEDGTPQNEHGYLLAEALNVATCDGNRGNICNGEFNIQEAALTGTCGDPDLPHCDPVASKCKGADPFSVVFEEGGHWCNGPVGCGENTQACTTEIVDLTDLGFDGTIAEKASYSCDCKPGDPEDNGDNGKRCFKFSGGNIGFCGGGVCIVEEAR